MESESTKKQTPEEQELDKKLIELAALETELTERELELVTTQAGLRAFEREYMGVVGVRYTEIDRVESQIAEYMVYLESFKDFKPSDSLKKLYREVAKRIHPDLATDENERSSRQILMADVNQAYEDGDEERLKTILHRWESRPESIKGEGVVAKLIRAIRKISQTQDRIEAIQEETQVLQQTELYQMKTKVIAAQQVGRDLLMEMASQLDEQITTAKQRLEQLKAQLGLRT